MLAGVRTTIPILVDPALKEQTPRIINLICHSKPLCTIILYSLVIQTKSWNKNSFGLYDYESRDIQKKTIKVSGCCKIFDFINL